MTWIHRWKTREFARMYPCKLCKAEPSYGVLYREPGTGNSFPVCEACAQPYATLGALAQ